MLFLSGGTTNPFVSLYLPSLAIAAAVLPWHLMAWLAAFAVACYAVLGFDSVPLNLDNPANLFDYYRAGMWVNFMVSVGLIAWFVARMSRALRLRDAALGDAQQRLLHDERAVALGVQAATVAHEIGTPLSTIAMLSAKNYATPPVPTRARAVWRRSRTARAADDAVHVGACAPAQPRIDADQPADGRRVARLVRASNGGCVIRM